MRMGALADEGPAGGAWWRGEGRTKEEGLCLSECSADFERGGRGGTRMAPVNRDEDVKWPRKARETRQW